MSHPYPPHLDRFDYIGKYLYSLTFRTLDDRAHFVDADKVDLTLKQILRAASETNFEITVYCFMPDHLHTLVGGATDTADCKRFIKLAKQYSAYYFSQRYATKPWQRYGYEHVIRSDFERATTIRYILDNPVKAGLVRHVTDYPFMGSTRYSIEELLEQASASDEATFPLLRGKAAGSSG